MSRTERPLKKNAQNSNERDGKRIRKVKTDNRKPKYRHLIFNPED